MYIVIQVNNIGMAKFATQELRYKLAVNALLQHGEVNVFALQSLFLELFGQHSCLCRFATAIYAFYHNEFTTHIHLFLFCILISLWRCILIIALHIVLNLVSSSSLCKACSSCGNSNLFSLQ